jgi:transcriptional regulator with XRE-family HTH domain
MDLLRKARMSRGLKKSQVANLLGIHRSEYGRIEERLDKDQRGASPELADRIAREFHNAITRDQILFPKDYASLQKAS